MVARLVIAGTTPGVIGEDGRNIPALESSAVADMIAGGTATAGMVAKLRACEHALANGVDEVVIVDGRDGQAIEAAIGGLVPRAATRVRTSGPTSDT